MGYNTAFTIWPQTGLSDQSRQLIDSLFQVLDDSTDRAGDRLADEIFSHDGEIVGGHPAKGIEEIRKCRKGAWVVIKTRRHEISQVYSNGPTNDDLLLNGNVTAKLHDGQELTSPFMARIVLGGAEIGKLRVQMYQTVVDTAPLLKAMKKL